MQKALANGRLPRAESPTNLLIANDPARGLAPGTGPGSTPGKLCLHDCRLLQTLSASHQSFSKHARDVARVNPWQIVYEFFLEKYFLIV